jgi:protein-S-isoprenylcysteine O-methyltransferase Ste14
VTPSGYQHRADLSSAIKQEMQALRVLANALWAAMLLPGVLIAMQCGVIECEERYRERGFGDEYRRYKAHVRRRV